MSNFHLLSSCLKGDRLTFKRGLGAGSTSVLQLLYRVCCGGEPFEGSDCLLGWKETPDSSAEQPLLGSLLQSSAGLLVHVILVRWTSQCCLSTCELFSSWHFIGNIYSLKCERFAKLGRICSYLLICRLTYLVRNVASVANVLEPRFNLLFFKYNCSVNKKFLSADLCWTHGCRL